MSKLREHLARALAKKIEAHGIVVWVDDHEEYGLEVARSLCPSSAHFAAWDGSWYKLRQEIEPFVASAEPPRVVIYQGVKTPSEDPLAEVRDAGTEFKLRLATLLRDAFEGVFTPARLEEVARQARTLAEAEGALTAGEIVEVRLQTALGTSDPLQLALKILTGTCDETLNANNLWEDARRFLQRAFGGNANGTGDVLKNALFRHLILVELEEVLGKLPLGLGIQPGPADPEQRHRARDLLAQWRRDTLCLPAYRDFAVRAQADLGLEEVFLWDERLANLDTIPVLEQVALDRVLELLQKGHAEHASELASGRRTRSIWARGDAIQAEEWQPRWQAAEALGRLSAELASIVVPEFASADEALRWYLKDGWRADQAHRRCEAALTEVPTYGSLDEVIREARQGYESWLETLLERFTRVIEREGLDTSLIRQSEIHKALVAPGEEVTAYVWVDALRYEMAQELADSLRRTHPKVDITAALGTAPTVTSVGMASLLPRAERGLRLGLSTQGNEEVFVDGVPVRTVQDRMALIRAAHGEVAEFLLTDLFDWGEKDLRSRIGSARLVVVRSREIDDAFESNNTAVAWRYVKEIREVLLRATARLAAAGVERFVIAADHGFFILSRPLGPERMVEAPGGDGKLHRRCWVGRGGSTSPSALRLPLSEFEVSGDLDLVVPRGLGIFGAGGTRRFLHGGLSPQELVVPVITVWAHITGPSGGRGITAQIIGNRITTGVFSASLTFEPDLFTTELRVRVSTRNQRGAEIARIVAGEGYEDQTGSVRLSGTAPQIVTFRVTRSLARGDRLTLQVHDADTDKLLARSRPTEVVADVEVD